MIELTGNDLKINGLTCLVFSAEWNIYHEKIIKMIDSFESENKNINFILIDIEAYKDLKDKYKINEIPTFIFLNGSIINKFSGMVLTKPFHSYCKKIIKESNGTKGNKAKRNKT